MWDQTCEDPNQRLNSNNEEEEGNKERTSAMASLWKTPMWGKEAFKRDKVNSLAPRNILNFTM